MGYLVSLCIPTNGVSEWVLPVLDSIYRDNVPENLFEVVVTDNGNNQAFESQMIDASKKHSNLVICVQAPGGTRNIEINARLSFS